MEKRLRHNHIHGYSETCTLVHTPTFILHLYYSYSCTLQPCVTLGQLPMFSKKSVTHKDRRIWMQPTRGPSVSCACVQQEQGCICLVCCRWSSSSTRAPPLQYRPFWSDYSCVLTLFLLTPLFKLGNSHQNTVKPQILPTCNSFMWHRNWAWYEQNSQTREIMPHNVRLVISWLLPTGRGDVNVINLARLTQWARSGI